MTNKQNTHFFSFVSTHYDTQKLRRVVFTEPLRRADATDVVSVVLLVTLVLTMCWCMCAINVTIYVFVIFLISTKR